MRVVITRPAGDAPAWVDALQAAGHSVRALPLIDIGPVANTEPLAHAWACWPKWDAVMFVSAQAVRYFFAAQPPSVTWARGPRCWATGPGTYKALRAAGVPEADIDSPSADAAQFDSEALWARVGPQVQAGQSVLIVRGHDSQAATPAHDLSTASIALQGHGRDWLAQQLQAAGLAVQFVVAYVRRVPVWTAAQKAQAQQAAQDGSVWCLSSSQAVANLARLLPAQHWSQARCLVTHARIARRAQTLGFEAVHLSRPHLADVMRSLESLA